MKKQKKTKLVLGREMVRTLTELPTPQLGHVVGARNRSGDEVDTCYSLCASYDWAVCTISRP